jgi:WXG100 protein secretion system (Wss), protein YukD
MSKQEEQKVNTERDKNLDITIKTPKGDWETTFPKTAKVSEVIQAIIQHFKFAANGKYELKLNDDPTIVLKPERSLVSYGVKDGAILVFIDFGMAV